MNPRIAPGGSIGRLSQLVRMLRTQISEFGGLRRSLIGASCMIVQPLFLNLLSIPVTAYIIASLGPFNYGQWSVALTLITTTAMLTNLGLRAFFVRGVAQRPETAPSAFADQLGLRLLLAVAAGLTSIVACRSLNYPSAVLQCTAILAVGAVFTAAAGVVSDLLQATERLPLLASVNLTAGLTLTIASVIAVWLQAGLLGLAVAYLLGPLVSGCLSVALVHHRLFPVRVSWNLHRFGTLLRQAKVLGLQLVVTNLGNHAENLLVPKLVGLTSYGYFAAGTLLTRRMEVVPDGLNTAFYPVMARTYQNNPREAAATMKRLGLTIVGACLGAALVIFALSGPISQILFPKHPEICRMIIRLTIWWVPLSGLAYGMGYAINASGREREEARLAIAANIVSLITSVILIVKFGLIGACIALLTKGTLFLSFRVSCFLQTLRTAAPHESVTAPTVKTAVEQQI